MKQLNNKTIEEVLGFLDKKEIAGKISKCKELIQESKSVVEKNGFLHNSKKLRYANERDYFDYVIVSDSKVGEKYFLSLKPSAGHELINKLLKVKLIEDYDEFEIIVLIYMLANDIDSMYLWSGDFVEIRIANSGNGLGKKDFVFRQSGKDVGTPCMADILDIIKPFQVAYSFMSWTESKHLNKGSNVTIYNLIKQHKEYKFQGIMGM